jgi:hypothetical protein
MLRALARPLRPSQLLCAFWFTQQLHSFNPLVPSSETSSGRFGSNRLQARTICCWLWTRADAVRRLAAVDTHASACAGRRLLSGGPGVVFMIRVLPSTLLAVKYDPLALTSTQHSHKPAWMRWT